LWAFLRLNADIPPIPQHILGATGARDSVAGRIRVAFAAHDDGGGEGDDVERIWIFS